jgi:hypothetical protein
LINGWFAGMWQSSRRRGWLGRAPWLWGEGSVVWLTGSGVQGTGLGGLRPVKAPPAPTTIGHGVLVGWSAARAEHRGRPWKSARELELERERWAARMRCERGYTEQLPDLAVWPERSKTPGAVIAESGGRREDRQKMILEGWRDAVWSGRYMGVRYDCASPSVARWINRLAKKVGLADLDFTVAMQTTAEQIATLPPAAATDEATATDHTTPLDEAPRTHGEETQAESAAPAEPEQTVQVTPPEPAPKQPDHLTPPEPTPAPEPEIAEAAAERERRYRELFGMDEPKPRRRWRR